MENDSRLFSYQLMLNKKYADFYLIYLSKYVSQEQKEKDFKRCADFYR